MTGGGGVGKGIESDSPHEQAQRVYALADRLQLQLRVLDESPASVGQSAEWATPGDSENAEIEALAFIVLMEASKSAEEDLKEIMASVKAIAQAKTAVRVSPRGRTSKSSVDVESILQVMLAVYGKERDEEIETLQRDLDAGAELSELDSLRLQIEMDRNSKMMSALSNLLKKLADTNSSIVQNLK